MHVRSESLVELRALAEIPIAGPGDDVAGLLGDAVERDGVGLRDGDVVVVCSKLLSRAEDRFVDLAGVEVSAQAREVAQTTGQDPRVVELILAESSAVSRAAPGVLVVRHRLGFVAANAGIDASNARPPRERDAGPERGTERGPWVLLLPRDPDRSAGVIRAALATRFGAAVGVIVSDSLGRPFRLGTVGAAIGVAGVPALYDQRGRRDLFGRPLEATVTALADQIAAAADLVAGQADEGRAAVHVRGLSFTPGEHSARELLRPLHQDLYA